MKNLWIIGIIVAWAIICIIGIFSWECKTDMYQGIGLGLGICIAVYTLSKFSKQDNEYDEYGDYRVKF